jgi:hypothetical protein
MAKENKPADAYAGRYKEVNPADVYSKGSTLDDLNISVGNMTKSYPKINPYGVKEMRGFGAATKGKKISGKQG